ncbi:unnamed protein product [Eruca vesicaria subsp. sativa]|uniref:Uncharacterized protein n=1 Tax=Eruca vesicaria subsp. sativa TaxID=29727 RepID=A0ABC8JT99_ERUVS|nr:unnamed protein product [Eruca vesicaria subsp. sativa]
MSQSVQAESSISTSNDSAVTFQCNRSTKIKRAWSRDNLGRRFLSWRGRRVGNGDIIREQKEEITKLKEKVRPLTHDSEYLEISSELVERMNENNEEVEALKIDVLILRERSAVLRNVLVASSIGFAVVIGSIMVMSKY